MNEPTAAAIAYGVDNMLDNEKNVLVFDLGGGTFDVSLLTVSKTGGIDVKAVGGDTHLGGEDFTKTLVNHCMKEFKRKHNEDMNGNPRALARLKVACEKAKRDLSSTTIASIEIDCLYKGIDFSVKISRAKFEELNSNLFKMCIELVGKCLNDGKIKKTEVDEVVVVGGSSRIPKVQRMLEDHFSGKVLCMNMNGDEAVAFGAAILAAKLSGNAVKVKHEMVLLDVIPLSLGVEIERAGERGYMHVIFPRNTCIPTSITKIYGARDYASNLVFYVYQGENTKVKDNILLGEFGLYNLTPGPYGRIKIEVSFNIDANGILHISAEETSTCKRKCITIAKT